MADHLESTKQRFLPLVILAGLTGILIFGAGYSVVNDRQFEAMRELNAAYALISRLATEAPGGDSLLMAAADGITAILDPYSEFLSPSRRDLVRELTDGAYQGIGIEMVITDGVITVVAPIAGSPAQRAGMQPGDRIVEIDGRTAREITTNGAVERLRGPPGSSVTVGVERAGIPNLLSFELTRAEIAVSPITFAGMTPDSIGYVRLTRFSPTAASQLDSVLSNFLRHGSTAWILDLRGNPGGYLNQAVDVAGCFLPEGTLVCETRGRSRVRTFTSYTEIPPVAVEIPLAILIDGGSASASEIVAAAIADHRRGVIVGRRSFGKGLVQGQATLAEDHALQLTTGRYFTPGGYSFAPARDSTDDSSPEADWLRTGGLKPHVMVEAVELTILEIELLSRGFFLNFIASQGNAIGRRTLPSLWESMQTEIAKFEIQFETPLDFAITQAESTAARSPLAQKWQPALAALRAAVPAHGRIDLQAEEINLKRRLAESLILYGGEEAGDGDGRGGGGGAAQFLPAYLELDQDAKTAREIIRNLERYRELLDSTSIGAQPES